jgi:hypothetical protein
MILVRRAPHNNARDACRWSAIRARRSPPPALIPSYQHDQDDAEGLVDGFETRGGMKSAPWRDEDHHLHRNNEEAAQAQPGSDPGHSSASRKRGRMFVHACLVTSLLAGRKAESPTSDKSELCRSIPRLQARALRLAPLRDRQRAFEYSLQ